MQVKSISYGRNKYISHTDQERLEVSAIVEPGDNKDEILIYLQKWVEEKMSIREAVALLESRKSSLQGQVYRLEEDIEKAKAKWQKAKDFLEKLGIENVDDIPF